MLNDYRKRAYNLMLGKYGYDRMRIYDEMVKTLIKTVYKLFRDSIGDMLVLFKRKPENYNFIERCEWAFQFCIGIN